MESTDLKNPEGLESRPENAESTSEKSAIAKEDAELKNESVKAEDESSMEVLKSEVELEATEPFSTEESEETAEKLEIDSDETEQKDNAEGKSETLEQPAAGEPEKISEEVLKSSEDDTAKSDNKKEEAETVTDKIEESEHPVAEEVNIETDKVQDDVVTQETSVEVETEAETDEIKEPDEISVSEKEDETEIVTKPEKESEEVIKEEKEDDPAVTVESDESEEKSVTDEKQVKSKDKEQTSEIKDKKAVVIPVVVQKKQEKPAYQTYSQIELINALREILDSNGEHDIREEVEIIKAAFYKKVKEEEDEQRKQFVEEFGEDEEFEPEPSPYEQDIKDLLKRYRQVRHEYNKKLEEEKDVNLQLKYDIIEEIKNLINKEESINKTFQEFRDLQQRWREIGLVPQSKMKDLWNNYHFHVENFYDYIKINKELRDLDLRKNLEIKIRLCEQAEELLLESNTIKAFNQLQKLHERWREVGPVPHENKDDIWERFKISTSKINKKHQEYFENRKTEQKKNLEAKRALCEQIEEINEIEILSHKEWAEKSKEVMNLQKVWRTIGFATQKENNRIYKRFRQACDKFFDERREFYSKNKEFQQTNLQMKTELCLQAEALRDSEDWHKTTQDLINIQKQWKETGPVPRKHSDILWKRFRAACDYFFEKKSKHFSAVDFEQDDNLKEKEQLINEIENFKSTGNADENLKNLKEFQRKWMEIGHVPIKMKDETQKRFRDAINKLFNDLKIDESKREILRFKSKIATYQDTSRGQNKMRFERDKYMTRLKQLENDLVLLDNNIGFFTKSKNAESLIKDVRRQIDNTKEKIEVLKAKIRLIDEVDQSDE